RLFGPAPRGIAARRAAARGRAAGGPAPAGADAPDLAGRALAPRCLRRPGRERAAPARPRALPARHRAHAPAAAAGELTGRAAPRLPRLLPGACPALLPGPGAPHIMGMSLVLEPAMRLVIGFFGVLIALWTLLCLGLFAAFGIGAGMMQALVELIFGASPEGAIGLLNATGGALAFVVWAVGTTMLGFVGWMMARAARGGVV